MYKLFICGLGPLYNILAWRLFKVRHKKTRKQHLVSVSIPAIKQPSRTLARRSWLFWRSCRELILEKLIGLGVSFIRKIIASCLSNLTGMRFRGICGNCSKKRKSSKLLLKMMLLIPKTHLLVNRPLLNKKKSKMFWNRIKEMKNKRSRFRRRNKNHVKKNSFY